MVSRVHVDFETRSSLDVKLVGPSVYAKHPSTAILCLAFAVDDGPILSITREDLLTFDYDVDPDEWDYVKHANIIELLTALEDEPTVLAHNNFFEKMIWRHQMVEKHGLPDIKKTQWRCTAAKAAARALPRSLEQVGEALNLPIQKDIAGNRVMMKLSRPRRQSKSNPRPFWEPEDNPGDFEILYQYNKTDVHVERLADELLPDLSPAEQVIWLLDQDMNDRGIKVDVAAVHKAIEYIALCKQDLAKEFLKLTKGQVKTPTQGAEFLKWISENDFELPNLQAATIDGVLESHNQGYIKIPKKVHRALIIRRQYSMSSLAKYSKILQRVDTDGRMRDLLMYHGASTGRWTGKGAQLHNLPRGKSRADYVMHALMISENYEEFKEWYPNPMVAMSAAIRGAFIPEDNHEFYVADYSAIEARVLAWLAGQDDVLASFAQGNDIYSEQASKIYNRTINRKVDITEGMVGKVSILALGYEGGINAFKQMASTYRLKLAPLYDEIWKVASPEQRERATSTYNGYIKRASEPLSKEAGLAADVIKQKWREANPKIVQFWRDLERTAIEAATPVKTKDGKIKYRAVRCGKITWKVKGEGYNQFLLCKLPSGRCLAYHRPQIKQVITPWGATKQSLTFMGVNDKKMYVRITAYGGLLAENITQAVSRDIMAYALVRIHRKGYNPILSVHDEGIAEVLKGFGSLEDFTRLMETPPKWARGLPIKAEAWSGIRYRKA